jgi:hypothetical protein
VGRFCAGGESLREQHALQEDFGSDVWKRTRVCVAN